MVCGGGGGPEELIGAIRTKFVRLKEEVDSELGVFAGDLVGALERGDEPDEKRRLALEDLLVAAQRCAEMEGSRAGANHAGRGEGGGRPSTQIGGGRQARPPPSSSSSAAGRELVRALEAGEPEAGAPDASRTRRGPARIRPERAPPPREASSAGLH